MLFSSRRLSYSGYNIGIFLVFYNIFRIICEFFREPDIQLGFIISKISMGQILSMPGIILGLYFINYSRCQSAQKSKK